MTFLSSEDLNPEVNRGKPYKPRAYLIFDLGAGVGDVFGADAAARVFQPSQLRLQLDVLNTLITQATDKHKNCITMGQIGISF